MGVVYWLETQWAFVPEGFKEKVRRTPGWSSDLIKAAMRKPFPTFVIYKGGASMPNRWSHWSTSGANVEEATKSELTLSPKATVIVQCPAGSWRSNTRKHILKRTRVTKHGERETYPAHAADFSRCMKCNKWRYVPIDMAKRERWRVNTGDGAPFYCHLLEDGDCEESEDEHVWDETSSSDSSQESDADPAEATPHPSSRKGKRKRKQGTPGTPGPRQRKHVPAPTHWDHTAVVGS